MKLLTNVLQCLCEIPSTLFLCFLSSLPFPTFPSVCVDLRTLREGNRPVDVNITLQFVLRAPTAPGAPTSAVSTVGARMLTATRRTASAHPGVKLVGKATCAPTVRTVGKFQSCPSIIHDIYIFFFFFFLFAFIVFFSFFSWSPKFIGSFVHKFFYLFVRSIFCFVFYSFKCFFPTSFSLFSACSTSLTFLLPTKRTCVTD